MPPSDDTQELNTATNSGGTSSSSVIVSGTAIISDTATAISATLPVSIPLTLQDQLSEAFETKMTTNNNDKENMKNLEGMAVASESSTSSNSSIDTPSELSHVIEQQPAMMPHIVDGTVVDDVVSRENSDENVREEGKDDECIGAESTLEDALATTATPLDETKANEGNETDENNTEGERVADEEKAPDGPLSMLRKGAVAAVGGTMVGVGLVMIPLPTPFGAVIASSGLAVLGTEFKEAKEMNDRLIEGAKSTVNVARDRIVKSIESMDADDSYADSSNATRKDSKKDTDTGSDSPQNDGEKSERIVKVPLPAPDKAGDTDEGNADGKETPKWLHMNPIEQKRQERIAKEKYRKENQTAFEQTKEYWTKRTGSFLSRNLLPLLKETSDDNVEATKEKRQKADSEIREDEGYVLIGSEGDDVSDPEEN